MNIEKIVEYPYINQSEDYIELITQKLDILAQQGEISIFQQENLKNKVMTRFVKGYLSIAFRSIYGIILGLAGFISSIFSYILPSNINVLYQLYKKQLTKLIRYEILIIEHLYQSQCITEEDRENKVKFWRQTFYDSVVPIYHQENDGVLSLESNI
jgi:hypothetical protein